MLQQIGELTRHFKPLKECKFSDFEVLRAMIKADIDPEEIASVTQLRGSRAGVIRIAMRTRNSIQKLDELVRKKKLCIGQIALGEVPESGHFVKVILDNVPLYISDSDVEEEMSKYGSVISSDKEYQNFEGCRIANEKRTVLFSNLFSQTTLDKRQLIIKGNIVFSTIIQNNPTDKQKKSNPNNYEQILDKIVKQLTECRRRSFVASSSMDTDDFQLEPDVLAYLQRRNSLKLRGDKKTNSQGMSSVALRQSAVVRDVGNEKPNDGYEILNWKDSKTFPTIHNVSETKYVVKFENKGEAENKVGWLRKFNTQKCSKSTQRSSNSVENTILTKHENVKTELTKDSKLTIQNDAQLKRYGFLKQPKINVAQKNKSCNEAFNSLLEVRKKQKRSEAFLQLSANLL